MTPPFRFPHDVDGWLSEPEGRCLAMYALGLDVLEIGSYCGRSTICLAQTAKSVVAVDPHDGRGTPKPRDTFAEFINNLHSYGVRGKVLPRVGTAADVNDEHAGHVQQVLRAGGFGLIFIDGAHDYPSVRSDIEYALRLLAPGGLLAFHDYRWGTPEQGFDPGVEQAVNELLATRPGSAILARVGSVAIVDPGKEPIMTPLIGSAPATAAPTQQCGSCQHFRDFEQDVTQRLQDAQRGIKRGECRRFPPQYTVVPVDRQGTTVNTLSYPVVPDKWLACAEHEAVLEEARSPVEA